MKQILVTAVAVLILVFSFGCGSTNINVGYEDSSRYPGYPTYEEVVCFHGHSCPGSMMGYRMAIAGMNAVKAAGINPKEICAIVENNACGVDALQVVTSCTFGKKKIVFQDYGKNVYTLFSMNTKKGFRISLHMKKVPDDLQKDREAFTKYLFEAPDDDILIVSETVVDLEFPKQTRESVTCNICKESVNNKRTKKVESMTVCIPCFKRED